MQTIAATASEIEPEIEPSFVERGVVDGVKERRVVEIKLGNTNKYHEITIDSPPLSFLLVKCFDLSFFFVFLSLAAAAAKKLTQFECMGADYFLLTQSVICHETCQHTFPFRNGFRLSIFFCALGA